MTVTANAEHTSGSVAALVICDAAPHELSGAVDALSAVASQIYLIGDDDSHSKFAAEKGSPAAANGATVSIVSVPSACTSEQIGRALVAGYEQALANGASVVLAGRAAVAIDAVGCRTLAEGITSGACDFSKSTRTRCCGMSGGIKFAALIRQALGSLALKLSSGYWSVSDACFGWTAINARALVQLPLKSISPSSFFIADLLHHLYFVRGTVKELQLDCAAASDRCGLGIRYALRFSLGHARNTLRRLTGWYFVRHFQVISLAWVVGPLLAVYGIHFGFDIWRVSLMTGLHATAGQVMNAALPTLIGTQLSLAALAVDRTQEPR